MVTKTPISVFCRIKPYSSKKEGDIQEYSINRGLEKDTITISCHQPGTVINNRPDSYNFQFEKIFDQFVSQEDIYEAVAQPVVQSALKGYNGTVFAYGQTGSGKTYTISGDDGNQGIVPRALFEIFDAIDKISNEKIEIHLSYMEIYNEHSNDLLIPNSDKKRISLRENSEKVMQWHNLGICPVTTLNEAMELLAVGDSNRIVGDTPMNVFSSRSHTILTIYITAHIEEEFVVRKAKLNLVDLAGSERVHKTGEEGVVLEEARHINLSLHYLEQVIVALSDSSRKHVPYRNCSMTSALRDSLGGNCMTVMVANIAVDKANQEETISTCRFAQRVALVRNELMINTENDLSGENSKLKSEIENLRKLCSALQGKLRILEKKQNKQMMVENTEQSTLNKNYADKQYRPQSETLVVEKLQTDVVYLIGWLQDEHKYMSANMPTGFAGNVCCTLTITDPEENFTRFINTLGEYAKEEWKNAKQVEGKAAQELSSKVTTIKDVHRQILEMWVLSDYSLKLRSSNSFTDVYPTLNSSTKDLSAECLLNTHTELLKDFQLLKYRLQSCKRNIERIKRKYAVEYNGWLKKVLAQNETSKESKPEINSHEEVHDNPLINGFSDCVHYSAIEELTRKAIKSNSERNISNHMRNLAKYGSLLPISRPLGMDDSNLNSTFDNLEDTFLSSSTRISVSALDNSSTIIDPGNAPRTVRSAPEALRHGYPETPHSPYNPYIMETNKCSFPVHNLGDGQTTTSFQLTGDDEIDDEIITFYKNKLANVSSDALGHLI